MNDLLKQRIARALEALSDERGYQVLDYIEFLESKYAERARTGGIESLQDTIGRPRTIDPSSNVSMSESDHVRARSCESLYLIREVDHVGP